MTKEESKTPAKVEKAVPADIAYVPAASQAMDVFLDPAVFTQLQRGAALLAASKIVPAHFRNDAPSCFLALEMAHRLKTDPFMLMNKTYIVHGKPGFEAQFVIGLINSSGRFAKPLNWELSGEGMERKATCYTVRNDGERVEATVTMKIAKAEGWIDKDGSKWKTMPDQMLQYRSASFFGRLHCPEVLMGMSTVDELYDVGAAPEERRTIIINPDDTPTKKTDEVASKLRKKRGASQQEAPQEAGGSPESDLRAGIEPEGDGTSVEPSEGEIDMSTSEPPSDEDIARYSDDMTETDDAPAESVLPVFTEGELNKMSVQDLRRYVVDYAADQGVQAGDVEGVAGCGQEQWTKAKCKEILLQLGYTL